MTAFRVLTGHGAPAPTLPKPDITPLPVVLTVQDGVPVIYGDTAPTCGIRVVHPMNPKAPSKNHTVVILYVPPHGSMELHCHETEETYSILAGKGKLITRVGTQDVEAGHHIFLPSWSEHGIENTGTEVMVALLSTSPPNP